MLDQQARDCEDQVRALQVCNRRRELKCRDLADAFRKLEDDWRVRCDASVSLSQPSNFDILLLSRCCLTIERWLTPFAS